MRANASTLEARAEEEMGFAAPMHPGRRGSEEGWPSLAERFSAQLTPFTTEELEAAKDPHPHAFQDGECGLFPVGEVSIIAAPGREGKTFATVSLAVSFVLGTRLVGLQPQPDRTVLVYSAEDDRPQYARKVLAHVSRLGRQDGETVSARVLVPDLTAPGMEPFASIVSMADRTPIESIAVTGVIEALRPSMETPTPPGLLIFETASTLSDAEEDNRSFRVLIRGLRRIARELQVSVVLVHHTSQAAAANLPELNIGVGDIRGATALAFNARQCFLLVNLGSEEDPFPESDARAVLRSMVASGVPNRVTALICLDSSKAIDPPPIFFRWSATAYGPELGVLAPPSDVQGLRWRRLHQRLRGERAERKQEAKDEARNGQVRRVVRAAAALWADRKPPTVSAVSAHLGRSPTWAKSYLEQAVEDGTLRRSMETVPRQRGQVAVYRPADSTAGAA